MNRSYKTKAGTSKFRTHLRSSIRSDVIERLANQLDDELVDSQNAMNQIASMFNTIGNVNDNNLELDLSSDAPSKFLTAEPLKLVMPELVGVKFEGELDEILMSMKIYADKLRKNLPVVLNPALTELNPMISNFEPLDVSEYAQSLVLLGKRLTYIRQNLKQEESHKDLEMEHKLELLNEDIESFKEMIDCNKLFTESTEGAATQETEKSLSKTQNITQFEELVNKLLSGINDVTCLRQNKG